MSGPEQQSSGHHDRVYAAAPPVEPAFCDLPSGVARTAFFSRDLVVAAEPAPAAGIAASRECLAVLVRAEATLPARMSAVLHDIAPPAWCEMSRECAALLGLAAGDLCLLRASAGVQVNARVQLSTRVADIAGLPVVLVSGGAASVLSGGTALTFRKIIAERV